MSEYHCTTRPNDPVYPEGTVSGITIREHFAAMAMQGMLAEEGPATKESIPLYAQFAVELADALIDALNKGEQTNG